MVLALKTDDANKFHFGNILLKAFAGTHVRLKPNRFYIVEIDEPYIPAGKRCLYANVICEVKTKCEVYLYAGLDYKERCLEKLREYYQVHSLMA